MKLKNEQQTKINKAKTAILTIIIGGQFFNIGCATFTQKDDSVRAILIKENELIKKIKVERSQDAIIKSLENNNDLKKAENHLILGLDEIHNSNEKILNEIMKPKTKEIINGKN